MAEREERGKSGYASWMDVLPDFALVVSGTELKCHKSFLAKNSQVMGRMFDNEYSETSSGKMEIKNFDLETVKSFLEYIYADKIRPECHESSKCKREIDRKMLTPQLLEMG